MDRSQKRREKHRKKREAARKAVRAQGGPDRGPDRSSLILEAAGAPMGPAYISAGWRRKEPELVTVLVSRRLANGLLLPAMALVDRTCLGVKDGALLRPMSLAELRAAAERIGESHGGIEPCEPLVVQSVVFHAIALAESLGFEPHPDFPEWAFGPRPPSLLETPHARPRKPMYVSGPHDDVPAIMAKLEAAVGPEGFLFTVARDQLDGSWGTSEDEEEEP